MKRWQRILVELLGPPFVAAVIFAIVAFVGSRDVIIAKGFIVILLFAYVFAGVPSVAFTVILEISFAKGLPVRSWRTVLVASGVGLVSGAAIAVTVARGFDNQHGAFTLFPALGLVTGFGIGVAIRSLAK